ncbi:hypothetical protein V6N13_029891 [Hibiscus sabdariffa]|uniref:Uncharacterized protein n=2 Tax=Hibiscus sabdariffa TaxID=183260 RepID=A0ABR2T8U3_9ROSI
MEEGSVGDGCSMVAMGYSMKEMVNHSLGDGCKSLREMGVDDGYEGFLYAKNHGTRAGNLGAGMAAAATRV